MVAQVLSLEEKTTHLGFLLDDGTGKMTARLYTDTADDPSSRPQFEYARRARARVCGGPHACTRRPGMYVRVHGNVGAWGGERGISAFQVTRSARSPPPVASLRALQVSKIENFNEITHHMLEVMHTHLRFKKGAVRGARARSPRRRRRMRAVLCSRAQQQRRSVAASARR